MTSTKKRRKELVPRLEYQKVGDEEKEDLDEKADVEETEVLYKKDFEKIVNFDEKYVRENCSKYDIIADKNVVKKLVYDMYSIQIKAYSSQNKA